MLHKLITIAALSALLFGVVPGAVMAECEGTTFGVGQLGDQFGLCWKPVPDSNIGGYRIYRQTVGDTSWEMWKEYDVILSPICDAVECETGPIEMTENLGRYYYVIRAYDTAGYESGNSNNVEQLVQTQPTYAANMGIRN